MTSTRCPSMDWDHPAEKQSTTLSPAGWSSCLRTSSSQLSNFATKNRPGIPPTAASELSNGAFNTLLQSHSEIDSTCSFDFLLSIDASFTLKRLEMRFRSNLSCSTYSNSCSTGFLGSGKCKVGPTVELLRSFWSFLNRRSHVSEL